MAKFITELSFKKVIKPCLKNCVKTVSLDMIKQLWNTGKVVTPYGNKSLYKIRMRKTNKEFAYFLQDLAQHKNLNIGVSTREMYSDVKGKASTDGSYALMLGYIKVIGKDKQNKKRYTLTNLGIKVVKNEVLLPKWFVYLDYDGKRTVIALSFITVSLQSLGGVSQGISLFNKTKAKDFYPVSIGV